MHLRNLFALPEAADFSTRRNADLIGLRSMAALVLVGADGGLGFGGLTLLAAALTDSRP
jgi:hypothetical protein